MPIYSGRDPAGRGSGSATVPRLKSIISSMLPVFADRPQEMPVGQEHLLSKLQGVWDRWSPHVGRIDIGGQAIATGWRVPGDGRLVVTAGHVLCGLLPPGAASNWFGGAVLPGATISFAPDGDPAEAFAITAYAAVHPRWDIAFLHLDDPGGRLAAAPVPDLDPGQIVADRAIAVLGFPGDADGMIFRRAGIRHLSFGKITTPSPLAQSLLQNATPEDALREHLPRRSHGQLLHNASTLPGHSGGLVVDVDTGAAVGLHVWGSAQIPDVADRFDFNDAVDLWAVAHEGWLAAWLHVLAAPAVPPAQPLRAVQPSWQGGDNIGGAERRHLQAVVDRLRFTAQEGQLFRGIAPDRPDDRDRAYTPSLMLPQDQVLPQDGGLIGDQGTEGSCAAFAVAAAIEMQLPPARRNGQTLTASVRMLDAMARDRDEFLDDTQDGTTLRAVLKGFFHNGVCAAATAPYHPGETRFLLTREAAEEARTTTLGAYFRVAASLPDMQMAVQEAGAVIVSAHIHEGWRPKTPTRMTRIAFDGNDPPDLLGAHAFVVVGYTDEGFIIRNSWGNGWGRWNRLPGHAIWSYADWANNVIDAWVLRLSASTPSGFDLAGGDRAEDGLHRPRRLTLLGHILEIERDWVVERGTFGLGQQAILETARYLAGAKARRAYPRLAFIFHDPMLGADMIARIAARMIPVLKSRKIYPLHIIYGADELRSLSLRIAADAAEITQGFANSLAEPGPWLERRLALAAQRQIADYRNGATLSASAGALAAALDPLSAAEVTRGRRDALILAAGIGTVPATIWQRAGNPPPIGKAVALASPVAVPTAWERVQLAPRTGASRIPGYGGDLVDLLAVTLAENAFPRAAIYNPSTGQGPWSRIETALIDRAFLQRL
ncbi:trypsin-like peptidase domain-containing protein [Paracoccus sp. S1E-3]|uniref:trypsin-like peptidase domain-containing protein n=1 Tax=Paracoccus sp. S1E-3 TaxID=2756130 RepID=UPI0015EE3E2F|nr:trypsin-like peptidase domain-containing protein [Paracoccus sp. S1E-3]MBA4490502.1 trypsin-like peptidase domain-containing protein [Paracoccus sp. S1E-3]